MGYRRFRNPEASAITQVNEHFTEENKMLNRIVKWLVFKIYRPVAHSAYRTK